MELNFESKVFAEDDYLQDGLRYCVKCKTPKETKLSFNNSERTVSHMCECQKADYEENERQREEREEFDRIQRMRATAITDKALRECVFEKYTMTEQLAYCKNFAEKFDEFYKNGTGLLLWGDTGRGKTVSASCIVNYLIDNKTPALTTSFPKILNELQSLTGEERGRFIKEFDKFKLLVIDDLGVERSSEYAQEQVYNVINNRYLTGKPFIITTNLSFEDMENPPNISNRRIYDRILERCIPIQYSGTNFRKSVNHRDMLKLLKG